MDYIFDTSTLTAIFRHYFADQFPSFWERFNDLKVKNHIGSVREVLNEIRLLKRNDELENWAKTNRNFFHDPTVQELEFITQIYNVRHFQNNLGRKQLLHGGPFADPFIIAKARVGKATVVTQEQFAENAARIPNICKHFEIACLDLQGFLKHENWVF